MHILENRCRPGTCERECLKACQRVHGEDAPLRFIDDEILPTIDMKGCTKCLACIRACPFDAIVIEKSSEKQENSKKRTETQTWKRVYEIADTFKPFSEENIIFARVHYDLDFEHYQQYIYSQGPLMISKHIPGYTRFEFELGQSAWTLYTNRVLLGKSEQDRDLEPVSSDRKAKGNSAYLTRAVKRTAKFFGSSLVGIAPLDRRWLYTADRQGEPYHIPETVNRAIVIAVEMDYDAISTSPAMLSSSASVLGYSKMAYIEIELSAFIRRLGYTAIPCGNDIALSVPLAIDAGLGQYGRHGLLITKKYGPRVRIAKILTDMPLLVDSPDQSFCNSVVRFCEDCERCAEECPSQSIPYGKERTWEGETKSNNPGIFKWYVDVETCYSFWVGNGGDCSNCIRSCPYNKSNGILSKLFLRMMIWCTQHIPSLNRVILKLDDLFGYGKQKRSEAIWNKWD